MVILDLGICPDLFLDVPRRFKHYLAKVGNLKIWKVHRFDRELTSMLSSLDCCSRSWNRFDMSFGTCMQNLDLF